MKLECRHINYSYPGASAPVLRDLSFSIAEPGFHALFGPSGVGKTSLARLLVGLETPGSGAVETHGLKNIYYTHNMERLPGWSSVGRHLDRVTPPHNASLQSSLLEMFDLSSLLNHRFSQLSLGQQNRINLVRYLVQDFQALIMDESLANVDEQTRGQILIAIKQTFPQALFLYISHNVIEVATFCRQVWVLRDARQSPHLTQVAGLDHRDRQAADSGALKRAMLEMMSAA